MAVDMKSDIRSAMSMHPNIWFRRKTYFARRTTRYLLRKIDRKARTTVELPKWNSFSRYQGDLKTNGYVYVENFLAESSAQSLRMNWPKGRYFTPIGKNEDHKTSDKGLLCDFGKPSFDTKKNPAIWALYTMFLSDEFANELGKLCDDGVARYPYHMLAQESYWGSGLAPHRDSEDERFKNKINFIYFVDANGFGWDAGGTSILKTNTFDEPVFIPQNLVNSCLFYYSESELFHGFPQLKAGKHRLNVISHFCEK
jgi:hypothetical protein